MPQIRVEFYGIARQRAGCAELTLEADTLREAGQIVGKTCPGIQLIRNDRLTEEYLISLNGVRFLAESDHILTMDTTILVLGPDAGG